MKKSFKKMVTALYLMGGITAVNAGVCNIVPGSVTCGKGTVENLTGNGTVSINGTTISGKTIVNGLLNAEDANFFSLQVNGSVKLTQCTVNDEATIKGSISASSTKFEKNLDVYSSETRFINTKVSQNLHLKHTNSQKQVVYLDNFSEVSGDVIFDDGEGEVILRGQSKIGGKVVGGSAISK